MNWNNRYSVFYEEVQIKFDREAKNYSNDHYKILQHTMVEMSYNEID